MNHLLYMYACAYKMHSVLYLLSPLQLIVLVVWIVIFETILRNMLFTGIILKWSLVLSGIYNYGNQIYTQKLS